MGKFEVVRENAASGSTPDVIFKYNGHSILALDYKGPNCIIEDEILSCCAPSVEDALQILPAPAQQAPSSSKGKGKATVPESRSRKDPTIVSFTHRYTQALLKQGVKYSKKRDVSTVLFYDYDYLLAMQPPRGLRRGHNLMLMDVAICPERTKSTENGLIAHHDNHAVVLLRYIIMAAQECEAKSISSSSSSKKNRR